MMNLKWEYTVTYILKNYCFILCYIVKSTASFIIKVVVTFNNWHLSFNLKYLLQKYCIVFTYTFEIIINRYTIDLIIILLIINLMTHLSMFVLLVLKLLFMQPVKNIMLYNSKIVYLKHYIWTIKLTTKLLTLYESVLIWNIT